MVKRRRSQPSARSYPRTVRVGELCREIVADELERIDDPRLHLVTITYVAVDADLRRAEVGFAGLGRDEEEAGVALSEHRVALQAAIARQARLRRTPELRFRLDPAIVTGARIEELLRVERDETDRDEQDG